MYNQAPIAQLVEQMTLNHWVLGSSPRGRTNLKCKDTVSKQCLFLPLRRFVTKHHIPFELEISGS